MRRALVIGIIVLGVMFLGAGTTWGSIGTPTGIGTGDFTTSHSSLSITSTAAVPVNNTVIVSVAMYTGGSTITATVTDSGGNTYTNNADVTNSSDTRTIIFSAPVTTALTTSSTITVSLSSSVTYMNVSAFQVSGLVYAASPVDKTATNTGTSTSLSSGTTATTTQSSELLIGAFGVHTTSTSVTFTAGTGYTSLPSIISSGDYAIYPEYEIVSATGAYSATGSFTFGVSNWSGAIVTYKADVATKLAFSTSPVSILAGACSPQITVQSQDSSGNAASPASTETIALSTSGSGGSFYSNSTCTTSITSVTIANTATSASFYWTDTTTGSPVITASGTGAFTSAPTQTETVIAAPTITKGFNPTSIASGGTSTLTLTITNPNASTTLTGVAVTDNLTTAHMTQTGAATTCTNGSVSGSTSTSIALTGAQIAGGGSCTVTATVTSTTAGSAVNTTGTVSSSNGGTGGTANATLVVVAPPTIAKAFGSSATGIPVGGTSTMTITITNPAANTVAESGVAVSDTLPGTMTFSTAASTNCSGGTLTGGGVGSNSVSLSGASIPTSSNCTITASVTDTTVGTDTNTTGNVSSANGGTGGTASAALSILGTPAITKAFSPTSVPINTPSTLTLTITNPSGNTAALTGVAVSDAFPANVQVASTPNLVNTCGGSVSGATAASTSISLSGGSVNAASSCTVSVNVTPTVEGTYNNTTGNVSATNAGTGNTGSASLTGTVPPTISKAFYPTSIGTGGVSTLTLSFATQSALAGQNGMAVNDGYPSGMTNATIIAWQPTTSYNNGQLVLDTYGDIQVVTAAGTSGATPPWTNASTTVGALTTDGGVSWADEGAMLAWQPSTNYAVGALVFDTLGDVQQVTTAGTSGAGPTPPSWTQTPGGTTTDNTVTWTDLGTLIWTAGLPYSAGAVVIDSNGNLELVTTAGTSGTSAPSPWNATVGQTTTDGTVVWTNQGPNAVNTCGGTFTATGGTGSASLSGGSLPIGGACQASVVVTSSTSGPNNNTTGTVSSTNQGTGATASASLSVIGPSTITKSFNPTSIPVNGTSTLTITITNPDVVAQTGVAVSDTFPTGMAVAATPGVVNPCGFTFSPNPSPNPGDTSINLSGGTVNGGSSCSVSVNVTDSQSGVATNTTGDVTSSNAGTNTGVTGSATANLAVELAPIITKQFSPNTIAVGGTSTLTLTITNPAANTVTLTGLAVSDTFPTGVQVASTPSLQNNCGGSVTGATSASGTISLSGGSVSAGSFCTISVNVTATAAGAFTNTTGNVTSTNGGIGANASAMLTAEAPPTIVKSFTSNAIPQNGTSTLMLTITNPAANTLALTGVAVGDTFPSSMVVAASPNTNNTCGGTFTATAGATSISLSGGSIPVNSSCAISVSVTSSTSGVSSNTTGNVSSTNGGTGTTASATLTVIAPPTIAKAFSPTSIPVNGTSTLTLTITNPSVNTVALTNVGVSDSFPAGMQVTNSPSATNTCGGTFNALSGATSISLSGATLNPNSSCSVSITVTSTASGNQTNTTGNVSSTNGGTGGTASATLAVEIPPTITKSFAASSIPVGTGSNTTMTLTITNPTGNTVTLTGLAVSDSFPTGLQVATTPSLSNSCGGTVSGATSTSTSISLSGGSVAASSSCTISVNVSATAAGNLVNTTGAVSSTNGGTGLTASATLAALSPPTITKAFAPTSIPVGSAYSSTLTLTITNPAANVAALTGVAVSDSLPSGLAVASTPNVSNTCGGTFSPAAGATSISLSGGSIPVNSNCSVSVSVTATTAGTKTNTTGDVSATNGGTGTTASATLTAVSAPTITKAFSPTSMAVNGTSTMTITITNPSANTVAESGVAVSDTFPSGMTISTVGTTTCTSGTLGTNTVGSNTISLSGATINTSSSCTITVTVTDSTTGSAVNTTGAVSSTNGGTGSTASGTLSVLVPPTITKSFTASSVVPSGALDFSIVITNPNSVALSGVAVSDSLPGGMALSGSHLTTGGAGTCGGTLSGDSASSTAVSLSGGSISANSSCTMEWPITAPATAGAYTNTTGSVSSTNGGTGLTASATLNVLGPPTATKTFTQPTITLPGGTSTLTITITNPSSNTASLTGLGFTDTFPTGMVVASTPNATNTCGGTFTATAGASSISISSGSGASVAANSSCTASVSVTATAGGSYNNSVTVGSNFGSANAANATLTVNQAPTITSTNSATFSFNTAGSFQMTASGYPASSFSESGALPTGVTLSSAGVLSGTPLSPGSFPITVTASNGISPNATQSFTLTVQGGSQTTKFTTAGACSWTAPAGVTSITVQCWGAGGGGGNSSEFYNAGGGGGGAYAIVNSFAVTPGTQYSCTVGAGAANVAGGNSSFNTNTCVAAGGAAGSATEFGAGAGGAGGTTAASTGTTKYAGGSGASGTEFGNSGGGGGSAGTGSAGNPGSGATGGAAVTGGGAGGNGASSNGGNGSSGSAPGGGGGGSSDGTGGAGAAGQLTITYTVAVPAQVVFVQQPSNSGVGATITPAVTVQVESASGSPISVAGIVVTMALTTGGGTLNGTLTQTTNSSGLATFPGLSISQAGTDQLTASSVNLTSAVSNSFTIGSSGRTGQTVVGWNWPPDRTLQGLTSPAGQ